MPFFSLKRIQREIKILEENSVLYNIKIIAKENFHRIKISIAPSSDTIYRNEAYLIEIKLDDLYPIEPPKVVFLDPIPVNEFIYSNGDICLSLLNDGWTPAYTLFSICLAIISILSSSTEKKKPVDDAEYCIYSSNKASRTSG